MMDPDGAIVGEPEPRDLYSLTCSQYLKTDKFLLTFLIALTN